MATSAGPGSCSITSIGGLARAAFTLAIWSTDSIGSSTIVGVGVGLAEGRHQHVLVGLLPAAGEGREHQRAGLGVAESRERPSWRRASSAVVRSVAAVDHEV